MTNKEYANMLLPNVNHDAEYYTKMYPERNLDNGAMVTRFAPSPTGFVHMGSLLSTMTNIWFAKQTHGICFLRIEDTDQKREVENGVEGIFNDFANLDVKFDEDLKQGGKYGPYIQSQRKDIYQAFAKKLIEEDLAYPCFCTHEEIDKTRELQELKKTRIGYYGKYAKCRYLSKEEVIQKVKNGESYIIRLKSPGSFNQKCVLNDCVRGKIEMPENDIDIVLIKADGLPTYHFAHAIDDHFMHTTHVMRGDEWIPSYPIHDQLFKVLGFELPNFVHLSPVNIKDGETVRKISKRKDPWAAISYYDKKGIPNDAIKLYLATLLNSNFEEWYNNNPGKTIDDFTFAFDKMSITGPLFDIEKLENISKTYFSRLSAKEIYDNLVIYTKKYDEEFYQLVINNENYLTSILNIERNTEKPRKDIAAYEDVKKYFCYMFDELFDMNNDEYEEFKNVDKLLVSNYVNDVYDEADDEETWFSKLKIYADQFGFTSNRKEYKANPENFKGTTADFCKAIRVIITKKNQSPNLYDVIKLLGKERLLKRINKYFEK
jgi:glutamyl-tRNA synthetase